MRQGRQSDDIERQQAIRIGRLTVNREILAVRPQCDGQRRMDVPIVGHQRAQYRDQWRDAPADRASIADRVPIMVEQRLGLVDPCRCGVRLSDDGGNGGAEKRPERVGQVAGQLNAGDVRWLAENIERGGVTGGERARGGVQPVVRPEGRRPRVAVAASSSSQSRSSRPCATQLASTAAAPAAAASWIAFTVTSRCSGIALEIITRSKSMFASRAMSTGSSARPRASCRSRV